MGSDEIAIGLLKKIMVAFPMSGIAEGHELQLRTIAGGTVAKIGVTSDEVELLKTGLYKQ